MKLFLRTTLAGWDEEDHSYDSKNFGVPYYRRLEDTFPEIAILDLKSVITLQSLIQSEEQPNIEIKGWSEGDDMYSYGFEVEGIKFFVGYGSDDPGEVKKQIQSREAWKWIREYINDEMVNLVETGFANEDLLLK